MKGEERRGLMMTVVWSCYRSGVPAWGRLQIGGFVVGFAGEGVVKGGGCGFPTVCHGWGNEEEEQWCRFSFVSLFLAEKNDYWVCWREYLFILFLFFFFNNIFFYRWKKSVMCVLAVTKYTIIFFSFANERECGLERDFFILLFIFRFSDFL